MSSRLAQEPSHEVIDPASAFAGTSVELFAGAGGLAIGMANTGFRHLLLSEMAPRACASCGPRERLRVVDARPTLAACRGRRARSAVALAGRSAWTSSPADHRASHSASAASTAATRTAATSSPRWSASSGRHGRERSFARTSVASFGRPFVRTLTTSPGASPCRSSSAETASNGSSTTPGLDASPFAQATRRNASTSTSSRSTPRTTEFRSAATGSSSSRFARTSGSPGYRRLRPIPRPRSKRRRPPARTGTSTTSRRFRMARRGPSRSSTMASKDG